MSSASLKTRPQFVLQFESYLRLDGKKHVLKGREHRRNRKQINQYLLVAFRLMFPVGAPSPEQLDSLKQAIDELHLPGITTRIEGNTVLIMTDTRCTVGRQRIKRQKIWLKKQICGIYASAEKPPVRLGEPDFSARAIRHGRQHCPRRLPVMDVTIVPLEDPLGDIDPATFEAWRDFDPRDEYYPELTNPLGAVRPNPALLVTA